VSLFVVLSPHSLLPRAHLPSHLYKRVHFAYSGNEVRNEALQRRVQLHLMSEIVGVKEFSSSSR